MLDNAEAHDTLVVDVQSAKKLQPHEKAKLVK
jgi:hypothetical protein